MKLFTSLLIISILPSLAFAEPVIPGMAREGLLPRVRGLVLMGELGCASCHQADGAWAQTIDTKAAPNLATVGGRVSPDYLRAFIARPHVVKSGTTMPQLPGLADNRTRDELAGALTHYLVSLSDKRFTLDAPNEVAARAGEALYHTVGCVACHEPRSPDQSDLALPGTVVLGLLEKKYSVRSLAAFLRSPHDVRSSRRMPDLRLTETEAYQVANFLVRDTRVTGTLRYTLAVDGKEVEAGLAGGFDLKKFARQRENFSLRFSGFLKIGKVGTRTFTLRASGKAKLSIDGKRKVEIDQPGRKELKVSLAAGLHPIELGFSHGRGKPVLELLMDGEPIPSGTLVSHKVTKVLDGPFKVDPAKSVRGKELFAKLDCHRCHQLDVERSESRLPSLTKLKKGKGCLSKDIGAWPVFDLSDGQRNDIHAALAQAKGELNDEQRIHHKLATFNCIACHRRGKWGGVTQARSGYFRSDDENLGEPGRLPPPLTGAGAKLQRDWLEKTIAYGQKVRPYMKTRMPAFGKEHAAVIAALLDEVDEVPPVTLEPLPKDRKKARTITDVGHQLVGTKGMNCIACHTFRGVRGQGSMAAIDVIETTTKRLNKDWFYHYMIEPARFRPDTIMPLFFPNGESTRKDIAGGDVKKQINGLWHYLAEGRNTRRPGGLTRPSMELVVGDEAVMLRRSAPDIGKRGISIGYPLKVNAIFDAESIALNQIWRGRFIDTGGVWLGQGSGRVNPLERKRVSLGKGPAFCELANESDAWPTKTSREMEYRFRGYDLDVKRRPTFHYSFGEVTISDAMVDMKDDDGVFIRRTISLKSPKTRKLSFRAAVNRDLKALGDDTIDLGNDVRMTARKKRFVVRAGAKEKEMEAILALQIEKGGTTLVIDYRWEKGE